MSLQFLKSYNAYYTKVNEEFTPPKKVKFGEYPKGVLKELEKESPEGVAYLNSILAELDNQADADHLAVQLQRKSQIGLTKEQMEQKEAEFKKVDNLELELGKYIVVYYKTTTIAEAAKTDEKLKAHVDELISKVKEWNKKNETIFKFANDVSDKVNNPDESNKALNELKTIVESYKDVVCYVKCEFEGHTSTTGDAAHNQTLSEGRANTIKNMFLAVVPEAKDWTIVATGKGASEPIVTPDDTEEKQQQNRRVEFKIDITSKDIPASSDESKTRYNIDAYVIIIGHTPNFKPGGKPVVKKWKVPKIGSWKSRIKCPRLDRK